MPVETERKFLVKGEFRSSAVARKEIVQAYLSTDPSRIVRLRIEDKMATLTIKGIIRGKEISRKEWEIVLSEEDAREIMDICLPGRIIKTRYLVPTNIHTFEVDVFHGRHEGLVIAEIELGEEEEEFIRPVWLGEEVTGNPLYYNSYLVSE